MAVAEPDLVAAVTRLAAFLQAAPLTTTIADLERLLDGASAADAATLAASHHVDTDLLQATLTVRRDLGRMSDLVHAAAILLVLPALLEEGEIVARRPSLAAGNDPSRPYDLETNRRVAEFKLSAWKGRDTMRQRHLVKDFVTLAMDTSGRRPELFVVGARPGRYLRQTTTTVGWSLSRFPQTLMQFRERFGEEDVAIRDFTAGVGARVVVIDVAALLPGVGLETVS